MTKQEAMRQTHQENALIALGFTNAEAEQLRRISMTLHRWHERECGLDNGCIERDETTNKPYWHNSMSGRLYPIADRETGARKRLERIVLERNQRSPERVQWYVQGDPRGAALYILRPGDVPDGADINSYYSRGIVVY